MRARLATFCAGFAIMAAASWAYERRYPVVVGLTASDVLDFRRWLDSLPETEKGE